jgi:hypothetical protein
VSHVLTVAIPMVLFVGIFLLITLPYIYLRLFFRFLSLIGIAGEKMQGISKIGVRIGNFLLFAVFGILILLYMWIKDIMYLL